MYGAEVVKFRVLLEKGDARQDQEPARHFVFSECWFDMPQVILRRIGFGRSIKVRKFGIRLLNALSHSAF